MIDTLIYENDFFSIVLIEFKVDNFLSFSDMQILRMAPTLETDGKGTSFGEISDMMFVYGANGSGKSNLVKAMKYSRDIALYGRSDLPVAANDPKHDSYFEYVVTIKDSTYSYGFEINVAKNVIKSEWLYILNKNEDECLFEWEFSEYEKIMKIPRNRSERNFRNAMAHGLPISYLNSIDQSDPIYSHAISLRAWFTLSLFIENSRIRDEIIPIDDDFIDFISDGLNRFDTGIVKVVEVPFSKIEIPENLIRRIPEGDNFEKVNNALVIINGGNTKRSWLIHVQRTHETTQYTEIRFIHEQGYETTIEHESLGTLRIIQILALYSMIAANAKRKMDGVLVIDEIECSVHTLIVRKFISLFNEIDSRKRQLIATTHRADVLRNDLVKEQNVSFIEINRSKEKGSCLYTLKSFDGKIKDIYRAYMDGRMGATPIFIDLEREE